jgi:DNA-binding transcriptional MerR regulator
MNPKAADAIFNKLCETFQRHGTDEWIDVYRLGEELGFSKEQVREALAWFEKDEQLKVEIDHSTTEHVRLGAQGKHLARSRSSLIAYILKSSRRLSYSAKNADIQKLDKLAGRPTTRKSEKRFSP